MIEKIKLGSSKDTIPIQGMDLLFDKLNELIATINEQEKKIDFIMENTLCFKDVETGREIQNKTLKELYEKR